MDNELTWLALAMLALVFFGAKRLPDMARSLGRSLRIFRAEAKGVLTADDPPTPVRVDHVQGAYPPEDTSAGRSKDALTP